MGLADKIRSLFKGKKSSFESLFEDLEDLLIESDINAVLAMSLVDKLREAQKKEKINDQADLINRLKSLITETIIEKKLELNENGLSIILILGVNGVGKTTTIAKLAHKFSSEGKKVILAAADTFRAAAVEQLCTHGQRISVPVIHQDTGSDPGAVVFDAIDAAIARKMDVLIVDTAGRMHTRDDLVKQLGKIHKIISQKTQGTWYKKILVLDANTGQNGVRQAETFHEAVSLDGIIMAKYDSSAKGGMVVSVNHDMKLPFFYLGTGEKYKDIQEFSTINFVNALFE